MPAVNTPSPNPPKLLDLVRDRIRVKHYRIRTETQYVQWVGRTTSAQTMGAQRILKPAG